VVQWSPGHFGNRQVAIPASDPAVTYGMQLVGPLDHLLAACALVLKLQAFQAIISEGRTSPVSHGRIVGTAGDDRSML
jgi:hypothetical protein